jgi:hypothetical protein
MAKRAGKAGFAVGSGKTVSLLSASSARTTDSSAHIAVMLSGLEGDDQPGGGGMTPMASRLMWEFDDGLATAEGYTWTRGELGSDVKMNEGNRAMWCCV